MAGNMTWQQVAGAGGRSRWLEQVAEQVARAGGRSRWLEEVARAGGQSRWLADYTIHQHTGSRVSQKWGMVINLQSLPFFQWASSSYRLHNLPKQHPQLKNTYSDMWAFRRHFLSNHSTIENWRSQKGGWVYSNQFEWGSSHYPSLGHTSSVCNYGSRKGCWSQGRVWIKLSMYRQC